jgi:hypothetical protein
VRGIVTDSLERSFFGPRFQLASDAEQRYLAALIDLSSAIIDRVPVGGSTPMCSQIHRCPATVVAPQPPVAAGGRRDGYMSSGSKRQTTMAKMNRERRVKERRALKQEKKDARKQQAAEERAEEIEGTSTDEAVDEPLAD